MFFHHGAEIPGERPLLEGDGKVVRYARFTDLASVEQWRAGLAAIFRAWCDSRP